MRRDINPVSAQEKEFNKGFRRENWKGGGNLEYCRKKRESRKPKLVSVKDKKHIMRNS